MVADRLGGMLNISPERWHWFIEQDRVEAA
jgi:hypothetical protein